MNGERTLRIYEVEGHGFSFEVSTDSDFVGSFDRVEVYTYEDWVNAHDENGDAPDYVAPSPVFVAGVPGIAIERPIAFRAPDPA